MGSLPSATTTACCARIEELLGRELDGIAQYNPASATMVSKTFSTVFIGGGLLARISARGEVYARTKLSGQQNFAGSFGFLNGLCSGGIKRQSREETES
jgi:hypothetical protein